MLGLLSEYEVFRAKHLPLDPRWRAACDEESAANEAFRQLRADASEEERCAAIGRCREAGHNTQRVMAELHAEFDAKNKRLFEG